MQDRQYDGVVLEDKWGKTYLCSSCLLARADLGEDYVTAVKDREFGRYFLHDLEPCWNLRQLWAEMYQQAKPWVHDLSKFNDFQLRDALLQIFALDEMWIWQLSEGWGQPPKGNGIGEGGLAPASGSGAGPAPVAKTAKPGGGATTEAPIAAKAASHEAKGAPAAAAKPAASKKVEPESLEHAQQILAERRKQIAQSGYQSKYSDAELLAMAQAGDIANDRFHVRLINKSAEDIKASTLGFKRPTDRAPYWATTFDMVEAADSDLELLACILGIKDYSPDNEYSLVIIDTHNMPPKAERQTFVPTFDKMTEFCNNELTAKELGAIGDVSAVLNDEFSAEYEAFMADYATTGKSEHNADAVKEHLMAVDADDEKINKVMLRHKVQSECGANSLYSGNGLTKVNSKNRYGKDVPQQYGAAETFTFERDPLTVNELGSSIAILPATPLRG